MSIYAKLFEGVEGLDEGFAERAETLLTAHVNEAVEIKVNEAKAAHETEIAELKESHVTEVTSLKESAEAYGLYMVEQTEVKLAESTEQHLSTFLNEWAEQNAPVLDSNIKVALAESFLGGLGGLMLEHNVKVPEGSDLLAESEQHAEELEAALNESIQGRADDKIASEEDLRELAILRESVGLTATEVDRVRTMSSSFALDESFTGRLKTIRTSIMEGADGNGAALLDGEHNELNENAAQADAQINENVHTNVDETLAFLQRNKRS